MMPHIDDGTLHALLDGALRADAPERADAVEAHLDACADCRARLEHAAALRDEASDVLAALDFGLSDNAGAHPAVPDFGEVVARADAAGPAASGAAGGSDPVASGHDTPSRAGDGAGRSPAETARLRRRLGWTRGLAWAATIVVALGTGYIIRDLAGPAGELPRVATPLESAQPVADDRVEARSAAPEEATDEPAAGPEEAAGPSPAQRQPTAEAEAPRAGGEETPAAPAPAPTRESVSVGAGGATPVPAEALEAAKTLADEAPDTVMPTIQGSVDAARTEMLQSLRGRGIQPTAAAATEPQPSARPDLQRTSVRADAVVTGILEADRLAGCYRLELGEWTPDRGDGDAPYQTPPAVFELMDSIGPPAKAALDRGPAGYFEQGRLLLRPFVQADHERMGGTPLAFWVPVPPDSVQLLWSNGFVGVRLDLAVRGDTLTGRAVGSSDAIVEGRPDPTAPARAVRVACPPK